VKKRQAKMATIEWARYAKNPSARGMCSSCIHSDVRNTLDFISTLFPSLSGRAILWLLTQQAIFILLSKILWFRRSTIRKYAGEQFTQSLLKLGPLYIKMGQIMSCRKNLLGSEWIEAMAILQDEVPAQIGDEAMELAYSTLEGGKAEFESLFSEFDSTPLAAASLGQVHRAKLRKSGDAVAVKVQRPFLRKIYDQDLKFLTKIAKFMDNIPGSTKNVGGVSSSWTKIFLDAEVILYREIDYRAEASNAIRFSEDFGLTLGGKAIPKCPVTSKDGQNLPTAADWIRTPYVFEEVSNERLLVMEFVPSIKITNTANLDAAGVTASDKIDLADALARAYLRQLCCNLFFSTDPHAGEIFSGVALTSFLPTISYIVLHDAHRKSGC
jgi:predicted unusual protein kinase regulating ubiquinone biosynthesis (AarF/ABC1/UbiB family)